MEAFPSFITLLLSSRFKWVAAALLVVLIDLLINLALLAVRPGLFLRQTPAPVEWSSAPINARRLTSTPFQPLPPTPTRLEPAHTELPATSTPIPAPSGEFYSIDFRPGAASIQLVLKPPNRQVNQGRAIVITVNPGKTCPFQKDRACVSTYRSEAGGNVIFLSVHSGVGGEAEAFRRALEGLGVERAGFSLKQIRQNLANLAGAEIQIRQGERVVDGLRLAAAGRVPPRLMRDYYHNPVEQALALAAAANPDLGGYTNPDSPILVFETCGWIVPGEPWAPGVTSTTGSVYLGVIQLAP